MVKFSILLILIAFVLLGLTLAPALSPNNDTLLNLLEPVLCSPGESLIQQVDPLARNTGSSLTSFTTNSTLSCKSATGSLVNVTEKLFGIGLTAFLVVLTFGVIFLIVGIIRNASGGSHPEPAPALAGAPFSTSQAATQVNVPRQPGYDSRLPVAYATPSVSSQPAPSDKFSFDSAETFMSIPTPTAAATPPVTSPPSTAGSGDLALRLKQLRDAFDAGLITQEEYDRSRANLLHDFADDD